VASSRDDRQRSVLRWVTETFGEQTLVLQERVMRFFEESVELAQAEGLTREEVLAVVEHVFKKPPGDPQQEAGGVGVTLLAYCAVRGFSADSPEETEFKRVVRIDPVRFRERQNVKADADIAVRAINDPARGPDVWGTCAHCGRSHPTVTDGTIFPHYLPPEKQPICPGSGKPPAP